MRKLLRLIPVLLLALGVMIAGIGGVGAQDQLTFSMVSHGGIGNPFWVVVIKGMEDACTLLDADCAWLSDPVDNIDDMAGYWDDALGAQQRRHWHHRPESGSDPRRRQPRGRSWHSGYRIEHG